MKHLRRVFLFFLVCVAFMCFSGCGELFCTFVGIHADDLNYAFDEIYEDDHSLVFVSQNTPSREWINYNNYSAVLIEDVKGIPVVTANAVYYHKNSNLLTVAVRRISESGDRCICKTGVASSIMEIDGYLYCVLNNDIFLQKRLEKDAKTTISYINDSESVLYSNPDADNQTIQYSLVLDGFAYLLISPGTHGDEKYDMYDKDLCVVEIETKRSWTIPENILSVGVIDGKPFYISKIADYTFELKEYDPVTNTSKSFGEFSVPLHGDNTYNNRISYTSSHIIIPGTNCFFMYDFINKEFRTQNLDFKIRQIVAFDKYLFISYDDYKRENRSIYRYCIATQEFEEICAFDDWPPFFFVASDTEVYVYVSNSDIRLYHPDGTYKQVTYKLH